MPITQAKTYAPIKERISFNLARMHKGSETFEIVLKNPDNALAFRQGREDIPMRDILEIPKIFSDAKKGMEPTPSAMKKVFGTDNADEIAKAILRKGELALTQEQRKAMSDAKRRKIIDFIHINAGDPRTGLPHPAQRIENAMEQAKVIIDPYQPVGGQIEKILQQLRPVLPLSFEKQRIRVTLPPKYSGAAYSTIKSKYKLQNEKWLDDSSVKFELEFPAGVKPDVFNLINKLTSGEAIIEELRK